MKKSKMGNADVEVGMHSFVPETPVENTIS